MHFNGFLKSAREGDLSYIMVIGNDFSFGTLLQTFRKRRSLTQQVLAEALG